MYAWELLFMLNEPCLLPLWSRISVPALVRR
jgi:hypothetical protein